MKHKFWIDCPLCNVKMDQFSKPVLGLLYFKCPLCDSVTRIKGLAHPKTQKGKYRRERLEERRIKP